MRGGLGCVEGVTQSWRRSICKLPAGSGIRRPVPGHTIGIDKPVHLIDQPLTARPESDRQARRAVYETDITVGTERAADNHIGSRHSSGQDQSQYPECRLITL